MSLPQAVAPSPTPLACCAAYRLPGPAVAALIALACCAAYWPAMNGGFIWDDETLMTENSVIRDPGGLYRIWFTSDPVDYWPVTNTTLWLEWRLWGRNPLGYHLTNLLLHVAASLLIWATLRKLDIPGAALAALLFAVHPVNVEAVAWIAQRKTVLATVFCLTSILCYLNIDAPGDAKSQRGLGWGWYALSLAMFILGMLSKGSIAMLPVLLLVIAWWSNRQVTRVDLLLSAPFFVVSGALVMLNIWFQTHGSGEMIRAAGLVERLAGAGAVVWFYLLKALLPLNLMFVYPLWQIDVSDVRWWLPLVAAVAVTALLIWQRKSPWGRAALFAWVSYCLALVPVMGFTDVTFMRFSLVANHYQYVALAAPLALVAAGLSVWTQRASAIAIAMLLVAACLFLSIRESDTYRDAATLWQATIDRNPESWLAFNQSGTALVRAGQPDEAIVRFQQALRLKPDYAEAHCNFGEALLALGRPEQAIEHYQEALRFAPNLVEAENDLGTALTKLGKTQEASEHFARAVQIKPDDAMARYNLATALYAAGRHDEAVKQFQESLRFRPDYPDAHSNLGMALLELNRPGEAIPHFQQVLQLKPDDFEGHSNLGAALAMSGRPQDALSHLQQALRLKPDYVDGWLNLAVFAAQLNRPADAIAAAQKGLELARSQGNAALTEKAETLLSVYREAQSKSSDAAPTPSSPQLPP